MDGLPFVRGAIWHIPRDVTVHVRADGSQTDSSAAAARTLTLEIKQAKSATELLDLLDEVVDGPIFNDFHASAAYHSLATKWRGGLTPSDQASPVLLRLATRVQKMTEEGQLGSREVANVLYSLGKLSDDVEVPKGLLMALVKSLRERASDMNAHDLSNNLLACVKLKGVAAEVLTALPKLAAQTSMKAKDMIPQALSNSLWAAARLKDDALEVLQMVPALVEEIPRNQAGFKSQEICNCLEALVLLRDSVKDIDDFLKNDFVGFTASRFSTSLPTLKRKSLQFDIPVVVWACARVNFYHEELLVSVAGRLKSGRDLKPLPDWGICALLWSYDVLDPDGRFANFKDTLESERVRRRLSDSDVSESQLGYFEWNRAKGLEATR